MSNDITQKLRGAVRTVPDFPIEGIMFRDITPVLSDGLLLSELTDEFIRRIKLNGWEPTAIIGPEARGFIFAPLIATKLGIAFIPIRKPGKLPGSTINIAYTLEYGSNTLEMHEDALSDTDRVVIVDDLLATGGTVAACAKLCEKTGAEVLGSLFVIELIGLDGRETISPIGVDAIIEYPA